jgi:DNA-binding transcriptional LysR family regulator
LNAVDIERGIIFDTAILAAQYALSGDGLALVDTTLFNAEVESGRLVKPFEASLDDGYGYYLITHPDGLADAAVALFRTWLIQRFGMPTSAPGAGAGHLVLVQG